MKDLKVITTRLPMPLYRKLKKLQDTDGLRMEWIMRQAVTDWLAKEQQPVEPAR